MKKVFISSITAMAMMGFIACDNNAGDGDTAMEDSLDMETTDMGGNPGVTAGTYMDLNTGETVEVRADESNRGMAVNATTGDPIEFYVDMSSNDTFYGQTGTNVNYAIMRTEEGKYKLDDSKIKWEGDELKVETDNMEYKSEGPDEYQYESGDTKIKRDGDEYKYKDGDTKVKRDGDEYKMKTDDKKIKVEDGEVKVKDR